MEKISSIKMLQNFIIVFVVSVILNFINNMIGYAGIYLPGILGTIVTFGLGFLSFASYILIWVSYAKSKDLTPTRSKYLILGILLTLATVLVTGIVYFASNAITSGAIADGTISLSGSMDFEVISETISALPAMKMLNLFSVGTTIILNIIYLGLAYVIFSQNKAVLVEAEEEHQSAYGN